jgi:integrase
MLAMPKIKLTEKKAAQLVDNPTPKKHEIFWDRLLPGFGLRRRREGARTYVAGGRFGGKHYRPLEVGDARKMTFDDARAKAREWLAFDAEGKDPRVEEAVKAAAGAAKKRAEEHRNGHTCAAVAADFLDDPVIKRQRKYREVKRHVDRLVQLWGSRPIHGITRSEALALIKAKAKSAPAEARNLRNDASQLFGWARDQDYGLEVNVFVDIKPSRVIGEKVARDRAFSIAEARQFYAEVSKLNSPYKEAYQLLALSGLRLRECTAAKKGEWDFDAKIWTVPADRMKGKNGKAKPFKVPLTDRMISILKSLKKFSGDYVFTTDGGRTHVVLGSKIKNQLDAKLQFAEPWVNHDLRRTVATRLTDDLGVKETVADAILAHRKKGSEGVYNRAEYVEQRRAALELWGNYVDPPSNVTPLRARA